MTINEYDQQLFMKKVNSTQCEIILKMSEYVKIDMKNNLIKIIFKFDQKKKYDLKYFNRDMYSDDAVFSMDEVITLLIDKINEIKTKLNDKYYEIKDKTFKIIHLTDDNINININKNLMNCLDIIYKSTNKKIDDIKKMHSINIGTRELVVF